MKNVDVIIVGGGPSGSTLGYLLQKNGISCCIIDKCTFPREKLCGGLLTQKTISLIDNIYGEVAFPYETITSRVNIFLGKDTITHVDTNSTFYLVERYDFDLYLINKYRELSGLLYENSTITSMDLHHHVAIINNKEEISFKIVVGADGANSQIRKIIESGFRPNLACLECNYPAKNLSEEVNIYFGFVLSGYGWCFPKKNHYTIGIGGKRKKNKRIRDNYVSFLKTFDIEYSDIKIKGAMLPCGIYVKKPCKDQIMLVGDAAGFVDSVTGEGIYFALLSAQYGFHAINDYLQYGLSLSESYLKRVRYIQHIIKDGNRFYRLFFNDYIRSFLLKRVKGRKTVIKYVCENIISNYHTSYLALPFRYLITKGKKKWIPTVKI